MFTSRLFIIRHGETDYNHKGRLQGRSIDAPLNKTGRKQAEAIGDYLRNYQVDKVVSSSLLRTCQTAEPIHNHFKLDLLMESDLDEMDFGKFEGQNYQTVKNQISEIQRRWMSGDFDYSIPGGESPLQVFERANRAVKKLMVDSTGKTIVFVLHGRLIRILLSEWMDLGLNNMQQVEHSNGSINQFEWNGYRFDPVYLHKTEHLGKWAVKNHPVKRPISRRNIINKTSG